MDKLSLVVVTETFPPEINGVAMTWGRLIHQLHDQGVRLLLVRPALPGNRHLEFPLPNIESVLVKSIPLPKYPDLRAGLPCGRLLRKTLADFKPDLVHVVTEGLLGWSALRAAKKLSLPVTSSFHTNFHAYGKHYGLGFLRKVGLCYLRTFHNRTLKTFPPTQEMCDSLAKEGFQNLGILGRGVDTELFHPNKRSLSLREKWNAPDNIPVCLYVGRMAAEKNLSLAVKAFRHFQKSHPPAKMVFVGDGPARAKIQKNNPDCFFAGMQKGETLAEHYASGDILLAPSITETFGNIVTEGMASGLAVVTFDYAAGRQHIQSGQNGFLAAYDNNDEYLQCLEKLPPLEELGALRKNARQTAENLSWQNIAEKFQKDLHVVIQNRS
ncbi:MAG: glycosyltransferase family 1 protein [Opitutales bacterium]|nr:glycosyltransferase family 1 protein [Opitutales bacterium]MCH8541246.1 glycosyltransferase family 1 protein [Opitutales bacterium]